MKQKWTVRDVYFEGLSLFCSLLAGFMLVFALMVLSLIIDWILNSSWVIAIIVLITTIVVHFTGYFQMKRG